MTDINIDKLFLLPEEMLSFAILSASQCAGPRLGRLAARGRSTVPTPHYVANTSRGVVPHVSHDNLAKYCKMNTLYMGLEDFMEKQPPKIPPILQIEVQNGDTPLRAFTGHSSETLLILGPRRFPPVEAPVANSNKTLAICTSVGFRNMEVDTYVDSAIQLRPDIILGPSDFVMHPKPSIKRIEKMCDRTSLWMREALAAKERLTEIGSDITIFAPILPVAAELQTWYTEQLVDDFRGGISGLYVHDPLSVVDLNESLNSLPRLAFTDPIGPSQLLYEISLGVDLFVLPFIAKATDGGIALDFKFPPPASNKSENSSRRILGIDAWKSDYATDVSPLQPGCQCYACQNHHRAYLHHLLSAKEMLAWVLLQIHNHHVLDEFFAGVRASIENGTFTSDRAAFDKYYEQELPAMKGMGPRIRGYQTKSTSAGESRKNPKAYNNLDNMAESLEEGALLGPDVDAGDLKNHGFERVSNE